MSNSANQTGGHHIVSANSIGGLVKKNTIVTAGLFIGNRSNFHKANLMWSLSRTFDQSQSFDVLLLYSQEIYKEDPNFFYYNITFFFFRKVN